MFLSTLCTSVGRRHDTDRCIRAFASNDETSVTLTVLPFDFALKAGARSPCIIFFGDLRPSSPSSPSSSMRQLLRQSPRPGPPPRTLLNGDGSNTSAHHAGGNNSLRFCGFPAAYLINNMLVYLQRKLCGYTMAPAKVKPTDVGDNILEPQVAKKRKK